MKKKVVKIRKSISKGILVYNIRQKRCFALISSKIQELSKLNINWESIDTVRESIDLNKDGKYEVEIFPEIIVSGKHSYSGVIETFRKMTETWIKVQENDTYETFILFSKYQVRNGKYYVYLDLDSLRYLTNFVSGNYSNFHLNSYIKLSSIYSMDLYMYISENLNKESWSISIEDFKNRIGCPENYTYQKIKEKILTPAHVEYDRTKAYLNFEVIPITDDESKGKGRKAVKYLQFNVLKRENNF